MDTNTKQNVRTTGAAARKTPQSGHRVTVSDLCVKMTTVEQKARMRSSAHGHERREQKHPAPAHQPKRERLARCCMDQIGSKALGMLRTTTRACPFADWKRCTADGPRSPSRAHVRWNVACSHLFLACATEAAAAAASVTAPYMRCLPPVVSRHGGKPGALAPAKAGHINEPIDGADAPRWW